MDSLYNCTSFFKEQRKQIIFKLFHQNEKEEDWSGGVTQQLRALDNLYRTWTQFLALTWELTSGCVCTYRDSNVFFSTL